MAEAPAPNILVVDDEPDIARSLKKLLERRMAAVVELAGSADEARGRLDDGFDLITLDYQMPGDDGLTLLEEIAARDDPPPVVMVTGHGDERTAVDAFSLGASGYVVKDQRLPELLTDAVKKALLSRRLKEAESALVKQVDRLQQLSSMVDGVSDAIFTLDKDLKIDFWNKGSEQLYGFEAAEAIGRDPIEILHTEYPVGFGRGDALREMEEKSNFRIEVTQYDKDGSRLLVDTTSWQFKGEDDNLRGITCINRDVTKEREVEARLANILDCLPDAVIVLNKASEILYVNDAMKALLKRDVPTSHAPRGLRGDIYQMFRAGTDTGYPEEETPIYRALRGEASTIDDVEIDVNGARVPIEVTAVPYVGPDGEVEYAVSVTKDITEGKRAEAQLKTFKYVAESSGEGFLVTGLDRIVTYTNAALDKITGYENSELIGKRSRDILLSDKTRSEILEPADSAYGAGGSWSGEITLLRKDGTTVPVLVTGSAITDEEGRNIGIVAFIRDRTKRVRD